MDLSNDLVVKTIIGSTGNPYRYKDAQKFSSITKFIGKGSDSSSTEAYRRALAPIANTGSYDAGDIVGVSVEGKRRYRIPLDTVELQKAIDAEALIITDNYTDRSRRYNMGEREVADYLHDHRYRETNGGGIWLPMTFD